MWRTAISPFWSLCSPLQSSCQSPQPTHLLTSDHFPLSLMSPFFSFIFHCLQLQSAFYSYKYSMSAKLTLQDLNREHFIKVFVLKEVRYNSETQNRLCGQVKWKINLLKIVGKKSTGVTFPLEIWLTPSLQGISFFNNMQLWKTDWNWVDGLWNSFSKTYIPAVLYEVSQKKFTQWEGSWSHYGNFFWDTR